MSPEQAMGQMALIDHRTDIYSLGATLYELLTLEPAFPGDEGPALIRQIERNEPRPRGSSSRRFPPTWRRWFSKAWPSGARTAMPRPRNLPTIFSACWTASPPLRGRRRCSIARPAGPSGIASRRRGRPVGLLALLGLSASTLLIAREQRKTPQNFALAEKRSRGPGSVESLGTRDAERLAHVPGAAESR